MNVVIPARRTEIYSLYCYSAIKKKASMPKGTLLITDKIAVLFYEYKGYKPKFGHRRGYVIEETDKKIDILPNIYGKFRILLSFEGRLVDEWKFLLYRLNKKYGEGLYAKPRSFWFDTNLMLQKKIFAKKKAKNKKTNTKKEVRHERTITRQRKRHHRKIRQYSISR